MFSVQKVRMAVLVGIVLAAGCGGGEDVKVNVSEDGKVTVRVPGVSVDTGPEGAKVAAPGVDVEADQEGAEIEAPGVNVEADESRVIVEAPNATLEAEVGDEKVVAPAEDAE